MLLHKSVLHDSRVRREAKALVEAGHAVTVLELDREADGTLDGFTRLSVAPPAWVRRALPFQAYRLVFLAAFVARLARLRPDVVHAHDAAMLLPGLVGKRLTGAKLVYDSHELATGVPYRDGRWERFVAWIERVGVPRADAVITVSDGIADRLQALYALRERPTVVRNLTELSPPQVPTGRLRSKLGIGDAPLVLHQGAPAEDRGCEVLIEAMDQLPGAHLCFLGSGERAYEGKLRANAGERVHFVPSVPLLELLEHTADADVGVSLLQDTCENHRLALPNKVFEYVAAGVPVVMSDLPEARGLVERHRIGTTTAPSDPEGLATRLRAALSGRHDTDRSARLDAASRALSWTDEREHLLLIYETRLLRAPSD